MSENVYDLGELEPRPARRRASSARLPRVPAGKQAAAPSPPRRPGKRLSPPPLPRPPRVQPLDIPGTLSLFVPGTGQMVRGEVSVGFFFFLGAAFIASVAWALGVSLERLDHALPIVGLPRGSGIWAMLALYGAACLLHVGNIIHAESSDLYPGRRKLTHPVIAGAASAVCPGWGQVLNGDRGRAGLFVTGVWGAGLLWILSSAPFLQTLETFNLVLPAQAEQLLQAAPVRWALPLLVWGLSVYDAAASAMLHRLR